ncbi:hypothetical protein [Chryseobacterium sp. MMS23-Vi53]|uniref:hypothetical protein n=1 Tax=Chryseobacterium sp. MMS23-Vi53 TaxID=3386644 RepID=UPI0039E8EEEF
MYYTIIKDLTNLVEEFERENKLNLYSSDIDGFKSWIVNREQTKTHEDIELHWEGKENGITVEEAITKLFDHLGNYEVLYSKDIAKDSKITITEQIPSHLLEILTKKEKNDMLNIMTKLNSFHHQFFSKIGIDNLSQSDNNSSDQKNKS